MTCTLAKLVNRRIRRMVARGRTGAAEDEKAAVPARNQQAAPRTVALRESVLEPSLIHTTASAIQDGQEDGAALVRFCDTAVHSLFLSNVNSSVSLFVPFLVTYLTLSLFT